MGGETFNLPVGPSDLCFDTSEFMKPSFSADEFLHNYRNAASLEQMRDDLGMYLKVLRNSMIELINADYQDFVHLSTELVDLDKRISDIQLPIEQLRGDIVQVRDVLTGTMSEITECLQKKREIRLKEAAVHEVERLTVTLDKVKEQLSSTTKTEMVSCLNLLERLSLDVVKLEFVVKLHEKHISEAMHEEAKDLKLLLLDKLKECFLQVLEKDDKKSIEQCLKIYLMLNEVKTAEETFRKCVVVPKMSQIICESSLQNNPQGLVGIYSKITDFVERKMKNLLEIVAKNPNFKDFDFLINAFWTEIEQRIELNMNSIFAPGNPDQFHQKFTSTLTFLDQIESFSANKSKFKEHPQYKSFMVKWNLMVYFQIRFQEIGATMESVCSKSLNQLFVTGKDFKLQPFVTMMTSIQTSWSDGVYLPHLFNRFFKLTLQLISRLASWIDQLLEAEKFECDDQTQTGFLMLVYIDVLTLLKEFPKILELTVKKAPSNFQSQKQLLESCFNESHRNLSDRLKKIEEKVSQDLIANSSPYIKQVNDIPRLYRKTNREVPTKNCAYVDHTLAATKDFHEKYGQNVGNERVLGFLENVFVALTEQYNSAVSEVLTSVQKTEESLRRLKNLRERGTGNTNPSTNERQGMSDDDKIRLQLQVDVIYWSREIEKFGIPQKKIPKLTELLKCVEEATKIHVAEEK
ncbi:conserved oligomeric Golgi complex subunit 2 [Culicoides brevitarsis]|uniref:conserved oligomeric Golgi complex subunit 2 n=1 Tax=Culicoides brevitarsis TaxID=469753 RepID=UPI00307BD498